MSEQEFLSGFCPKCGESLKVPAKLSQFSCMYCGARLTADELLDKPAGSGSIAPEEALRHAAEENAEEKEEAVGEDGFLRRFCDNMKQESKKRFMKKDEEPGGFTDKLKREIEKDDDEKDT